MKEDLSIPSVLFSKHKNTISIEKLTAVNCNLCNEESENNKILFTEANRFNIYQCRRCGLIYVSPQPEYEDLHKYYEGFFSEAENSSADDWHHDSALKQIESILDSVDDRESILEVGSGHGHFLRLAKKLGFKKIVGLEPDTETSNSLKKDLPFAEIINTPIEKYVSDSKISCIVMLASLEHFKNPTLVLTMSHNILKQNGIIIIRVPFWEGYFKINGLFNRNIFPFGSPRHLYDFSPRSLTALLKKTGFDNCHILPGAKEKHEVMYINVLVTALKWIFTGMWRLTGKRYISPFTGSIVAVAKKKD